MSGADRHAGDRLAALADGRLSPADRAQVLAHLGRCARCRSDYDEQLTMKGLLGDLRSGLDPSAPADLRARLSDLARPYSSSITTPAHPGRPPRRRSTRPARSARRRTARAGAGLVSITALVLVGGYALGGAPQGAVVTPPIDRFVREHVAVSGGLPLTEPVLWQLPASEWPTQQVDQPLRLPSAKVSR